MKFKVGNIIVYSGRFCQSEIGREQVIVSDIDGRYYITRFLDDDSKNRFDCASDYKEKCLLVNSFYLYDNGIPLIWEDEL